MPLPQGDHTSLLLSLLATHAQTLKAGRINTELRMAADSDNGGFQDNIWRLYLAE